MSDLPTVLNASLQGVDYQLEIQKDPDPQSPREGESFGTMLYNHRRYVLGDECIRQATFEEYLDQAGIDPSQVASLPLYLLDHSGLRMRTEPFDDPWDSGCVGVIYVQHDKILEEFKVIDEDTLASVQEWLQAEVAVFDQFISGEVYGFRLLTRPSNSDQKWQEESSAWGFYGSDMTKNGMLDHLSPELADELKSQIPSPRSNRPR